MIYGLYDPRNGELRYVGYSRDVVERLRGHLKNVRRGRRSRRDDWIRSLLAIGLTPEAQVIEHVSVADVKSAERFWIAYFRLIGCALTNLTDGGDGLLGFRHTPEARARMSAQRMGNSYTVGYTHTAATRALMADAHRGRKHDETTRAKISASLTGRRMGPPSDETRAKIAAANKGRRPHGFSPESRARMSAAKVGRPWSEARRAASLERLVA